MTRRSDSVGRRAQCLVSVLFYSLLTTHYSLLLLPTSAHGDETYRFERLWPVFQ